jgi:tRNA A22 N-methylase
MSILEAPQGYRPKSAASNDKAASIGPGIFATSHKAEQKFWQQQADNMQRLAKSANSKNKYQSELHTMKKELKVARSELRNIENQLSVMHTRTLVILQSQPMGLKKSR